MSRLYTSTALAVALIVAANPALAQTSQTEIEALKAQMKQMQEKIAQLENAQKSAPVPQPAPIASAPSNPNAFNPAISAVLNGHYGAFSDKESNISGFGIGEEAGRSGEGLTLDEAELNINANIDDKFFGNITAALAYEDGETEVELEEAYIKTLGLPYGLSAKAGRFFAPIGYINENHAHTDDFADRALPNRVFLNGGYKDNGIQASIVLPTDLYSEIGAFGFQGNDFPGGGNEGSDPGAYGAYAKLGGDIGDNQSWLAGFSMMHSKPENRIGNDDNVTFNGDSNLYAASLRYTWDPTGNPVEQQVTLQGEYFLRDENGTYEDIASGIGAVNYDGQQSGWYAQGVYKFLPEWRVGARYSRLDADDVPFDLVGTELNSNGHDPWNATTMVDWSNSEFSRIRLQYGYEELADDQQDNQILLQYIVSLGAHPAHKF